MLVRLGVYLSLPGIHRVMMQRTMVFSHKQNELPLWAYKMTLLVAAAIWGMGTVVIKATVNVFPPPWLVGVRFTGAGIILGLLSLRKLRDSLTVDDTGYLRDGALLGVLLFLSYWTNSTGLTDTTASNSAFLTTLYVVIIPFLGWLIMRRRPTKFNIAAALACISGVACVAYSDTGSFSLRAGDLFTLLSAIFLSLHVLYTAKLAPGRSVTVLTVVQFLVAGIMGFIAGLLTDSVPNFAELSAETWVSLVYLTVFASCVALGLQNAAVARVDPAQAALFLATESVFGVTFSIVLLGESVAPSSFVGFILIFFGIVISEYLPLRAEKMQPKKSAFGDKLSDKPNTVEAWTESMAQTEQEASAMEEADVFLR